MRREDCIVDCVGPDCEGCRNYKTRQMKDEIKDKIIEKQDEYIFHLFKRLNDINTPLYVHGFHSALADEAERLKSELASLKSQLSEAGEEKRPTDEEIEAQFPYARSLMDFSAQIGAKWARDFKPPLKG